MDDLISRQTAYEVLTEYYHHTTETQHTALREALGSVPSADAVEVVRCKDCKALNNLFDCWCSIWGTGVAADAFCNYGERQDG